uniref:Pro-neuregulin-3, membrane-bound isoform n=1 Tax=Hucho hucho TaxID=62062 RepID=A0A4W5JLC4_9TELE
MNCVPCFFTNIISILFSLSFSVFLFCHLSIFPAASPTIPPLVSEHFKQCHEKDLAYCLNDGECFVIETLSGPHKHCRCREGYQGIRCDQFLPKTDSILSDPSKNIFLKNLSLTVDGLSTLTVDGLSI